MQLTNANTSSNEALSVRANVLAELRESVADLSPFAQAMLAVDSAEPPMYSDTPDTYFMNIWESINQRGPVSGVINLSASGEVGVIELQAIEFLNVNQGNEVVDIFRIKAVFGELESMIGYQYDKYVGLNGKKGEYKRSEYDFTVPTFLNELDVDTYVDSISQQLGSIDVLLSLANMAVAGPVSYADVMSVLSSSGTFINPKLHGIISQYATHLNEANACTIINLMISDYFEESKGYYEEEDQLKFNTLDYTFDSSCLLGWHQITGLLASAVSVVASIFSPVAGFIVGAIGSIFNSVSDFIANADESAPKLIPEAAHNIASLPVWQSEAPYNELHWAYKYISRSGRLTLTTDFFKLFVWLKDEDTLAMEMYVNTGFGYNVVEQWRKGKAGDVPSGTIVSIRDAMGFSNNSVSRSFQTLPFPNADSYGSWILPGFFGVQTIPAELESSDQLYSRMFNGLFLSSLYALYASNSSVHLVSNQTRSNSLPSDYTVKDRLLWFVGAYLDTYAANLIESSIASWLVKGWFTTLRDFASTLDSTTMLLRMTGAYFEDNVTRPSLVDQDYGKSSDIRTFVASTITSKGSAMVIPPMSKYSINQKLAVTAGIAAIVSVGALIASRRIRSIRARHAQDQRFLVEDAYSAYRKDPSTDNWNAFYRQVKKFNRWTYFNGASRISAANWGGLTAVTTAQTAAVGDAALASLLRTDAANTLISKIIDEQIPGLEQGNDDLSQTIREVKELIVGSNN